MAVTCKWYGNGPKHLALGDIVWKASGGSDIRVALMGAGYSFDQDAHETWASTGVSTNEIAAGSGYTAGGATLAMTDASYDTATNETRLKASAATTWTTSTITAYGAIVYKYNATGSLAYLLGYVDFGGATSSTSADFTVTWDSTYGVLKITAA